MTSTPQVRRLINNTVLEGAPEGVGADLHEHDLDSQDCIFSFLQNLQSHPLQMMTIILTLTHLQVVKILNIILILRSRGEDQTYMSLKTALTAIVVDCFGA